jgi:hypothetical protein
MTEVCPEQRRTVGMKEAKLDSTAGHRVQYKVGCTFRLEDSKSRCVSIGREQSQVYLCLGS